jgi:hypothetical protein
MGVVSISDDIFFPFFSRISLPFFPFFGFHGRGIASFSLCNFESSQGLIAVEYHG